MKLVLNENFYVLEIGASDLSPKVLVTIVTLLILHDLLSTGCNLSHEHAAARAAAKWDNEADLGKKEHPESFAIFKPAVTFRIIWFFLRHANNARGAEVTDTCQNNSGNMEDTRDIEAADGGPEQGEFEEA